MVQAVKIVSVVCEEIFTSETCDATIWVDSKSDSIHSEVWIIHHTLWKPTQKRLLILDIYVFKFCHSTVLVQGNNGIVKVR